MSKNKKLSSGLTVSNSADDNINTIILQAKVRGSKVGISDACIKQFIKDFRKSITDKQKVNEIFWKVLNLYLKGGHQRQGLLITTLEIFKPYEFIVYQLLCKGTIVYIGKTDRSHARLVSHTKDKDFDEVRYCLCLDTNQQDLIENTCILKYKPKYNKAVRLSCVVEDMDIPNFLAVDAVVPDFVPFSGGVGKIPITDKYYHVQGVGFVCKSRVINIPYWLTLEFKETVRQKEILTHCKNLMSENLQGICKKGSLVENLPKFESLYDQLQMLLSTVTEQKFKTTKLGIIKRLDELKQYFERCVINGVEVYL